VVGDVILIEAGMRIPADCILIDGMDITVDETMYGFSDSIKKNLSLGPEQHIKNPDPFLLSRSLVRTGSGRAVVCAVGNHTRWFKEHPVEDLEDDNTQTPLQVRLDLLAKYIGKWSYFAGALTLAFLLIFLTCKILFSEDALLSNETLQKLLRSFTTAVAIVIVSVPEGLPLAVSIAMAFSVDYMKRDNLLVKKMAAVEKLGDVKDICTGKTATLTQNNMRVKKFFIGDKCHSFGGYNGSTLNDLNDTVRETLVDCIIKNTDARIEMSADGYYEPTGNGTEVAMLRFLQSNEVGVQDLLTKRQRECEHECSIPFSPARKRMATVYRPFKGCDIVRVVVKGAPEYVMPLCDSMVDANGDVVHMSESKSHEILFDEVIGAFATKEGLRTFVYAYKDFNSEAWEELQAANQNFVNEEDRYIIENNLVFLAGFGIEDKLREGVATSIANLKKASIRVRMVSGDNIETAKQAALKAGILDETTLNDDDVCMTGKDLMGILGGQKPQKTEINGVATYRYEKEVVNNFSEDYYKKIRVLARCTPEEKLAFIVALQTCGSQVSVTADGLNDVSALQQSEVGFCMGESGCEIAKEASDIIFLDDNFNSVFKATLWGRNILDNIRKFIQFQLPVNLVCVLMVFLGGATLGNSPFSVIQLLWINLIMDTLAAISLATEPPSADEKKWGLDEVRSPKDKIILPVMWRNILT
jgi:magnesium-transporting ATPase (P-type)